MAIAEAQLVHPLPYPAAGVNNQALSLVGGGGAVLRPTPRRENQVWVSEKPKGVNQQAKEGGVHE